MLFVWDLKYKKSKLPVKWSEWWKCCCWITTFAKMSLDLFQREISKVLIWKRVSVRSSLRFALNSLHLHIVVLSCCTNSTRVYIERSGQSSKCRKLFSHSDFLWWSSCGLFNLNLTIFRFFSGIHFTIYTINVYNDFI